MEISKNPTKSFKKKTTNLSFESAGAISTNNSDKTCFENWNQLLEDADAKVPVRALRQINFDNKLLNGINYAEAG